MKKATKQTKRQAIQRRVATFTAFPVRSNGLVDYGKISKLAWKTYQALSRKLVFTS